MLKGKCPSCGKLYFGWALRSKKQHMCHECNVELEITQDDQSETKPTSLLNDYTSNKTSNKPN